MQEMAGWVQGTCPSDKTPMFVAHNGNRFDFPRLFRHGSQSGTSVIHQDWLCLDTLVLLEQNKDANSKHFHGLTQVTLCSEVAEAMLCWCVPWCRIRHSEAGCYADCCAGEPRH